MKKNFIKIGDLFNIEKGSLQSSKNIAGKYDFITAAETWKSHELFSHNIEALVFAAAASGSLGRTHYVKGKFIASDLCFILTPKDLNKHYVDLKFYHFVFNNLRDQVVKATKTGTSKDSINITNFSNYQIPYLEKLQQIEWIEKLRKAEKIQNELLQIISEQETHLGQLRQSILQEAVQGRLTKQSKDDESADKLLQRIKAEKQKLIAAGKLKKEKELPTIKEDEIPFKLPNGWVWCRLAEIVNLRSGVTLGKTYKEQLIKVPYLRVANVQRGYIDINNIKELFVPNSEIEKYSLQNGDLVMIEGGDWDKVGRCAIWQGDINPCIHQNHIFRLRFYGNIYNQWAELFLNSPVARRYFESCSKQTTNLASINKTQLSNTLFPLPSLSEQQRIVTNVEQLMQMVNLLGEQVQQSQTQAQQLLQTVLKEAFANKAKVYETNEEITMAAE